MIDTHCHFDIMSNPEAYIYAKEVVGDIVIGMTNLPSHFCIGEPYMRSFKHVRLALGLHPLLAADKQNELQIFKNYSIIQTAWEEIPLSSPVKPKPSSVVALTLTAEIST